MIYFEDVEVRRSRVKGVTCRVTLRKGDTSYSGEAEGVESERSRAELAARAALLAIVQAETEATFVAVEGCKMFEAFDARVRLRGDLGAGRPGPGAVDGELPGEGQPGDGERVGGAGRDEQVVGPDAVDCGAG